MSQAPQNFVFHNNKDTLSWDSVQDAIEYQIVYCPVGSSEWCIAYEGPNTECDFQKEPGTYQVKGKSKDPGGWGEYGAIEHVIVGTN